MTITGHNVTMEPKQIGIADLKAHLSDHLREVRSGHALVIVDRGHPVAQILPLQAHDALVLREPRKPFAAFPFVRKGRGKTDSVALLLEDRKVR